MCKQAVERALRDSQLQYKDIQAALVGYVYGDSASGQRALYEVGQTGIPIVNLNNNCATGATTIYMGAQWIQGGLKDCLLCLGFDKM